jgi:hypothetical protein
LCIPQALRETKHVFFSRVKPENERRGGSSRSPAGDGCPPPKIYEDGVSLPPPKDIQPAVWLK